MDLTVFILPVGPPSSSTLSEEIKRLIGYPGFPWIVIPPLCYKKSYRLQCDHIAYVYNNYVVLLFIHYFQGNLWLQQTSPGNLLLTEK